MTAEERVNQICEDYENGKIDRDKALREIHWLVGNCDHEPLEKKKHIMLIICDIVVKIITLGIVKLIKRK